ncbi:hypothetical protein Kpol_483p17 [Vanderwaltozyma polyspora DSM 70294]|uniref:Uncharacterized protein n=1 Tax=Vanderwaltozyma polyspora (strain ATCC 22028 / DSM 70294 / BCRC 21397 / CBS 2163 / NBRC 10782 / NRRL Y-8283 / UCD 57-17) TaxID=436907 RepID=A7TQ69_VANPO|nr:uncharacterized protein Kpol_483p17 [Vanderwaltozyma polyspora DSM 70294]EDO15598.1 hypothetical protein Kpol_483p17 [Vanderwaltozyma polyspora DSM 70294]
MSDHEYDDLDDLLDEDPSKLENAVGGGEPSGDPNESVMEDGDDEVKAMMSELESEFQNLMKNGGAEGEGEGAGENSEIAENFRELMGMLGKSAQTDVKSKSDNGEKSNEFKDIVANTLNKIKENGTKVDDKLRDEKKNMNNSDDLISQLLSGMSDVAPDGNLDDTILGLLNQMSSKEVLYEPLKETHSEYTKWFEDNTTADETYSEEDHTRFKKQYGIIGQIIQIYEAPEYNNEKDRQQLTDLLDALEQLGNSPVNNSLNNTTNAPELNDLLEIDGNDPNFQNLEKELQDTCQQQ